MTFVDLVNIIITRSHTIRIAARFSIAVHILTLLGQDENNAATSEYMAGSIGTNPVIVRNVIGQLRRAGLVQTSQGVAGTRLTRRLADITLLDVYRAVEVDGELFSVHTNPNPNCTVGSHIQSTLEGVFGEAQRALEGRLAATTVADVLSEILSRASA